MPLHSAQYATSHNVDYTSPACTPIPSGSCSLCGDAKYCLLRSTFFCSDPMA